MNYDDWPELNAAYAVCAGWMVLGMPVSMSRNWGMQLSQSELAFNALTFTASTA